MHELPTGHGLQNSEVLSNGRRRTKGQALQKRSVIESRSASSTCDALLRHYLSLEEKPVYALPDQPEKATRVIYTTDSCWGETKRLAVLQKRTVSSLLEQLTRAYLGLELQDRVG